MATKKRLHQTFDEVQEILDSVPDWNAGEGQLGHINNRTHWAERGTAYVDSPLLVWEIVNDSPVFHVDGTDIVLEQKTPIYHEYTGDGWGLRLWVQGSNISEVEVFPANDSNYVNVNHDSFPRITQAGSLELYTLYQPQSIGGVSFIEDESGHYVPRLPYTSTTFHKLDNQYLDLDTTPTSGSGKPITSGGVYAAIDGNAKVKSGTTAYWVASGYIPAADEIIVYTDKSSKIVGGETVYTPGIKVGSGNAYVSDLAFVGDDVADSLLAHVNDNVRHITAAERSSWNNKLNVDDNFEVVNGVLIFNRN